MKTFSLTTIFLIAMLIFNAHTSAVIWIAIALFIAIDVTINIFDYRADKKRSDAQDEFMRVAMDFSISNTNVLTLINENQKGIIDNLRQLRMEHKEGQMHAAKCFSSVLELNTQLVKNFEFIGNQTGKILKVADPEYKPFTDIQMKQLVDFILQHFPNAIDRSRNKK